MRPSYSIETVSPALVARDAGDVNPCVLDLEGDVDIDQHRRQAFGHHRVLDRPGIEGGHPRGFRQLDDMLLRLFVVAADQDIAAQVFVQIGEMCIRDRWRPCQRRKPITKTKYSKPPTNKAALNGFEVTLTPMSLKALSCQLNHGDSAIDTKIRVSVRTGVMMPDSPARRVKCAAIVLD